ncbi:alkaline phosphatase family protein [Halorubrum amylolyticum]|uniref:hypothetical protein n=1 Tax=Halorubrum amylolyticum TaxID=2508724 RepID=UPI0010087BFD|nr:hypothetical protein [Halorubrum amylolyticum]
MSFRDFLHTTREWVDEEGLLGLKYAINQAWMGVLRRSSPLFEDGTNVYEKDWDLLLILDACRVDAIEEVADEYSFLDAPGTMRSSASTSIEWMEKTFTDEYSDEIENTIYVTANQHSSSVEQLPFVNFENVYDYGWDDETGTVPAEVVTDVSVEVSREYGDEYDRMIVHYMQPHFPSIPEPLGHGNKFDNVWKGLMVGRGDENKIWESYIANLRYVLDQVEVLLENVDADTVAVSADHGNGIGEWGVYEHPVGIPTDSVKTVPWYITTASDLEKRHPSVDKVGTEESSPKERLESLGYR